MYKYQLKGWLKNPDSVDEVDEEGDVSAPLPGELDRPSLFGAEHGGATQGVNVWAADSGQTGGVRLFAKDKRKLREKRRSTGVVKYCTSSLPNEVISGVSDSSLIKCRGLSVTAAIS
jgi:hypothetical protein